MRDRPRVERIRHELKRRKLIVRRVEPLPSRMVRVVLGGEELSGFTSLGFDDHVKLFFPSGQGGLVARDFTPRQYDRHNAELWIDFYIHDAGPATAWAAQATAGQILEVGGPKGSAVISVEGIDTHLLVGDETALPAIGRRLQELPRGARARVVLEIDTAVDRPSFTSGAEFDVTWVPRDSRELSPASGLIAAIRRVELSSSGCFAWVAHESKSARAVRAYLRDERGLDLKWIKAAGYWQHGASGAHDKFADTE